ncbi:hypothetical protein BJ973_000796 [Actinoplanes tereljensis]|uniref:Uncharacterized protein n=1 Tax=Paractinoplanes tereljensis TaxID=571912 RepID=A0A919NPT7_9ACTN|nr:CU044_5270 family protein [Actinoplanes tereljensis]GIF22846.1 hypothetical protein Ate02nite_55760 [Actinoplanes tereljensis]
MMDEISILRETFEPDPVPSAEAEQRARAALLGRMAAPSPVRRHFSWRLSIPITAAVATAVVVAFAVSIGGQAAPTGPSVLPQPSTSLDKSEKSLPYLQPASAAQVLENAAWTAEQEPWVEPRPDQFMYVETLEMRNKAAYENKYPNGALVPGKAAYRKIQSWQRIDGQIIARTRNTGKIEVFKQTKTQMFAFIPWSQILKLTTPEAIVAFLDHPEGGVAQEPGALAGTYVLPPNVKAAIYRYLAQQPGMKVNPDAVNLDGRPAIGLGRVEEGYLSRQLLFDPKTYTLIGDRMVAVNDEKGSGDGRKGDLYRQVIYTKMVIVDKMGDTA